MNYRK